MASKKGIVYAPGLSLDVYRPPLPGDYPLVTCVHGGGWHLGTRAELRLICQTLAAAGYVAIAVDYSLTWPDSAWPNQLEQVLAARAYALSFASEWWINPAKSAMLGTSAGGHLAQMAACTETETGITCVVSFSAATDLPLLMSDPTDPSYALFAAGMDALFGVGLWGTIEDAALLAASPVAAASSANPPTFIAHSEEEYIPTTQASEYADTLTALGVENELHFYPGSQHGTHLFTAARADAMAFLAAHLA